MNNDNKRRNLNKKNSDNMVIKIAMIILGLLLVFVLTLYAVNIFTQGKTIETDKETQNEIMIESESENETQRETVNETVNETETERETETEKETVKETETERETQRETESERETQEEQTQDEQTQAEVEPTEPSQIPVPEYTPTVNISIDTIRNASQSDLVDMIIRGELGYGAERLDLLQKAGKDYYYYNNLVNERLKELGY